MDDPKLVFSDLTFTSTAAPARVQSHPASATTPISEDPTIKGIFAAAGARMQVSAAATPSAINTVTIKIPKSQVAMLAKKGATIFDQGGDSYSMNASRISNIMFNEDGVNGASNNKVNEEIKPPYLLYSVTLCANEEVHLEKIVASPL